MEIGTAIRAVRPRTGEIGDDVVVKDAIDNSSKPYKLALAIGDKVRLFDRVHDAGKGGRDGTYEPITSADVLRRAGDDMGRRPERGSALQMLERVRDQRRGSLVEFQRGMEPVERQIRVPGLSQFQDLRLAISPVMHQVIEYTQNVARLVTRDVRSEQSDVWSSAVEVGRRQPRAPEQQRGYEREM
jgi:hypothetical protein